MGEETSWIAVMCWSALGLVLIVLFLVWARTRIEYRIGERHLKMALFGVVVRRIRLADIDRIGKRRIGWSENWGNTFRPSHRRLVIHRTRGLFRYVQVTPLNRYIFRRELEMARDRTREAAMAGQAEGANA